MSRLDAPRTEVEFRSGEAYCAAWHYPPVDGTGADPVVVMAHGFGATREGGLAAYAERFAAAGMHALVFDYRGFGDSGGDPRQVLDIRAQHADWRAAIDTARSLDGVDPTRLALWGSSFAGGHVIALAARSRQIAAVVAQVPHVSGPASAFAGPPVTLARIVALAVRDAVAARRGRAPVRVPIAGAPGTVAAMTSPDALPGYLALYGTEPGRFTNEVAARVALHLVTYSPLHRARHVTCPLLVQIASQDVVTPPRPARRAARRAPAGQVYEYPCGHFDVYRGEMFERVVTDQVGFLTTALRPAARDHPPVVNP